VGVLLDRPRISPGAYLARNLDDADDNDTEFSPSAQHASSVVHEGYRRLDGHMSRLRVWLLHRVLGRERAGSQREDQSAAAATAVTAAQEAVQHH